MRNIGPHRTACGFTLIELLMVVAILAAMAGLVIPIFSENQENSTQQITEVSLSNIRQGIVGTGTSPGFYADMKNVPGYVMVSDFQLGQLVDSKFFTLNPTLLYNSETRRGWRGPYIQNERLVQNTDTSRLGLFPADGDRRTSTDDTFLTRGFHPSGVVYGTPGDRAVGDNWGNPIVLQIPSASAFSWTKLYNTTTPTGAQVDAARWRFARIVSAGQNGQLETALNGAHLDALCGKQTNNSAAARGDDIVIFLNRSDIYEDVAP